jgi:hypothetical protein
MKRVTSRHEGCAQALLLIASDTMARQRRPIVHREGQKARSSVRITLAGTARALTTSSSPKRHESQRYSVGIGVQTVAHVHSPSRSRRAGPMGPRRQVRPARQLCAILALLVKGKRNALTYLIVSSLPHAEDGTMARSMLTMHDVCTFGRDRDFLT